MGFKHILCYLVMMSCALIGLYYWYTGNIFLAVIIIIAGYLFCMLITGGLRRKKKKEEEIITKRSEEISEEQLEKYRKMFKKKYYGEIQPRLKEAGTNSEILYDAINDYIGWEKQVEILGFDDEFVTEFDDAYDLVLEGMENLLNEIKEQIESAENQEEYTAAVNKFIDSQRRLDLLDGVFFGLSDKLESIISEINSLLQS